MIFPIDYWCDGSEGKEVTRKAWPGPKLDSAKPASRGETDGRHASKRKSGGAGRAAAAGRCPAEAATTRSARAALALRGWGQLGWLASACHVDLMMRARPCVVWWVARRRTRPRNQQPASATPNSNRWVLGARRAGSARSRPWPLWLRVGEARREGRADRRQQQQASRWIDAPSAPVSLAAAAPGWRPADSRIPSQTGLVARENTARQRGTRFRAVLTPDGKRGRCGALTLGAQGFHPRLGAERGEPRAAVSSERITACPAGPSGAR